MAFFLMLLLMVMLMAWSYDSATTTDKVAVTEMLFEINIKYQQPSTQHKTHIDHTRHMKLAYKPNVVASYMLHNVLTHCFIWLVDNKYYSRQRMNIKRVNNFTMSLIQMVCLSASRIAYISLIWSDAPGCRTTYNVQRTKWPYETQGIYDNDAIFVWCEWWVAIWLATADIDYGLHYNSVVCVWESSMRSHPFCKISLSQNPLSFWCTHTRRSFRCHCMWNMLAKLKIYNNAEMMNDWEANGKKKFVLNLQWQRKPRMLARRLNSRGSRIFHTFSFFLIPFDVGVR